MRSAALPVAVIGAGPVGLAAAAELVLRGEEPIVFEFGPAAGSAVREWSHVRVFSPWRFNVASAARRLLQRAGWEEPDADYLPTGRELVDRYLEPLSRTPELEPRIRFNVRVLSIARQGFDKLKTAGRERAPFELAAHTPDGELRVLARAVVDASGTWGTPNPLGANGVQASGELAVRGRIAYGIPDVLGGLRSRYAGRKVLVVGSGHSAFNVLLDLRDLEKEAPGGEVTWAIRRREVGRMFGGGTSDALLARAALGRMVEGLVETGAVQWVTGFAASSVVATRTGVVVRSADQEIGPFDEVIAATGFRPDLTLTSELRLDLDPVVEAPRALAPLIDPNVHSCGTVPPHGVEELSHPEVGYYAVGMKSCGRAPTFLMMTGYEQVRSVVAALTGDDAAARRIELQLPETGVCSSQPVEARLVGETITTLQQGGDRCCGGPPGLEVAGRRHAGSLPAS